MLQSFVRLSLASKTPHLQTFPTSSPLGFAGALGRLSLLGLAVALELACSILWGLAGVVEIDPLSFARPR